jgi:hypothetical protein
VLHKVIRCLSLGTGQTGGRAGKQIGRINYAELGIVQLGSVYEGLLSYRGFFATEDLIQVLQAPRRPLVGNSPVYDDAIDPKTPTWFVPKARLEEFKTGEVVIERRTKQPRIYAPASSSCISTVSTASTAPPTTPRRCSPRPWSARP